MGHDPRVAAIVALLVSGATVSRATVVSPLAGDAQIGEYFRVFVAYAVITVALAIHAWQSVRAARARN